MLRSSAGAVGHPPPSSVPLQPAQSLQLPDAATPRRPGLLSSLLSGTLRPKMPAVAAAVTKQPEAAAAAGGGVDTSGQPWYNRYVYVYLF